MSTNNIPHTPKHRLFDCLVENDSELNSNEYTNAHVMCILINTCHRHESSLQCQPSHHPHSTPSVRFDLFPLTTYICIYIYTVYIFICNSRSSSYNPPIHMLRIESKLNVNINKRYDVCHGKQYGKMCREKGGGGKRERAILRQMKKENGVCRLNKRTLR